MNYLKKIFFFIKDYKKKVYLLFFLIATGSLLELVSIGILIPVMSYFLGDKFFNFENFNFLKKEEYIYFLLFFILFIFIFKIIFFLYLNIYKNNLLAIISSDLSKKLFSIYIRKDYSYHLKNSSPKLIGNIDEILLVVNGTISAFINVVIDLCIAILIVIFLLNIHPVVTIILLLSIVVVSLFYYLNVKNYLKDLSEKKFYLRSSKIKFLQESFSGIREIKLFNNYEYAIDGFQNSNSGLLKIISKSLTFSSFPKLIFEFLIIFLFIILILFLLYFKKDFSYIAFLLGIFLISSIRILPIVGRLLSNFQNMKLGKNGLYIMYNEFKINESENKKNKLSVILSQYTIPFEKEVKFENVNFAYHENSQLILKEVSMSISRGDIIAIIGDSGAGKSTFLDLFCGLLKPTKGKILIDNKNLLFNEKLWQSKISYISQSIFLNEGTILENVTFGQKTNFIDNILLEKVLTVSGLNNLITKLPLGIETYIGEKGLKLSGGQKQRIGIARALYRSSDIIIFDEATNALDLKNEQEVIESVKDYCKGKTLIFISHRKETLKYCNVQFKLENKEITKII
jgi:ABC-type bacteriocin/lantibiotic exporter with double-glycine peptidase domain